MLVMVTKGKKSEVGGGNHAMKIAWHERRGGEGTREGTEDG